MTIRTNLSPAEHRAFARACRKFGAHKSEVLYDFARWFTRNHSELAAREDWLAPMARPQLAKPSA